MDKEDSDHFDEACPPEALDVLKKQTEFMRQQKSSKVVTAETLDDVSMMMEDDILESSGSDFVLKESDLDSSDSEYEQNIQETPRKSQTDSSDSDEILAEIQQRIAGARKRLFSTSNNPPAAQYSTNAPNTSERPDTELPDISHESQPGFISNATSAEPGVHDGNVADSEDISNDDNTQKRRSRKRTRNEKCWKRNVLKNLRTHGRAYMTNSGKQVVARTMKCGCGSNCHLKCHSIFSEDKRKEIFGKYWSLDCKREQRHFINNCVSVTSVKRKRVATERRNKTYQYFFFIDQAKHQVCKTFFLDTLDVKRDFVYNVIDSLNSFGTLSPPKQGRHGNQAKVSDDLINSIKDHIKMFPTMESHYCRKNTSKKYLPSNLSVREMYRMYKEIRGQSGMAAAQEAIYRRVFNNDFNLSFLKPKKDQCDQCTAFHNMANPTEEEKEQQRLHQQNKTLARQLKDEAKQKAMTEESISAGCFDFQQILTCPHGQVSNFYYKRKLGVFNFTVYDLKTADAYCYMWPENEARRGPNEVGTCLRDFISHQSQAGVKTISLFSDNCGGQNRNRFVAFMLWHTVKACNITKLVHTFLEKGHTQTENDSVHSVIENATKKAVIYTPQQWFSSVRNARKSKQPYIVKEMIHSDFIDFKKMAASVRNLTMHDDRQRVKWSKIRQIIVHREDSCAISVVYEFGGPEHRIDLFKRRQSDGTDAGRGIIEPVYLESHSGIQDAKKKDLINLCDTGLIPRAYLPFFENLPIRNIVESSDEDNEA